MKFRVLFTILVAVATVVLSIPIAGGAGSQGNLLSKYEEDVEKFKEAQFGNFTSYQHLRQIGDAVVEGDGISYIFNTATGELIEKEAHWRDDLPTELPQNLITKAEALAMVGEGNSSRAYLYYISPDSDNFQIEPLPKNPCWVVWETREAEGLVCQECQEYQQYTYRFGTVIDAVTGEILASGIPPISNKEVAPVKPNTAVLSKNVETTFLGVTSDDKYQWEATIGAPKYLDDLQTPIDCHWEYDIDKEEWNSCANLFTSTVKDNKVTVEYQGIKMKWQPQLEIESKQQVAGLASLLAVDPINENYYNNTLSWDFGNGITRNLRIIEGMLIEYYTISELPTGNITIKTNTEKDTGFVWTRPEVAWDANYTPVDLIADGDNVTLTLGAMQNATFPITIDPPTPFTASSSDGCLEFYPAHSYQVAREAEEASEEPCDFGYYFVIGQYYVDDRYYIGRSFVYFDTASLPENIDITSATLRLRGAFDHSDQDFYIQIQSGMPDHPSEPDMVKADYNKEHYSGNGGELVTTDFVVGSYNEISLTNKGKNWINTTGWTKFCLRSTRDINPGGEPDGRETVATWAYEMGEDYWPELKVTYVTKTIQAFALTGPKDIPNCTGGWYNYAQQAANYFEDMGYPTLLVKYPDEEMVKGQISNNDTVVFYEAAHSMGSYYCFRNGCSNETCGLDVREWIAEYPKMPFTFFQSCWAMCYFTGNKTLASAFMKDSVIDTAAVGFCGIPLQECDECSGVRRLWEDRFFYWLSKGQTVGNAYYLACGSHPSCCNESWPCVRFAGDPSLTLVPKIYRRDVKNAVGGEVRDVNGDLLSNVLVSLYEHGGGFYEDDVASPDYCIEVDQTGEYWLHASRYAYFTVDTNAMPGTRNPWHEDYIDFTTAGLLAAGYTLDFEGDYGLVPKACNMSCAMTSVNHCLFVPIDGEGSPHPEWQLSSWKAMASIHSWQYPS